MSAADTNASLATWACTYVTSSTDKVAIYSQSTQHFLIPECIVAQGTSVTELLGYNLIVPDWALLPSTITSLHLAATLFTPSSTTVTGFDTNGNVDWQPIFARMVNLSDLSITNSQLSGSLPASLPKLLSQFTVTGTQLSGTIPRHLFSESFKDFTAAESSFSFVVPGNQLSGTIPADLFETPKGTYSAYTFDFGSNSLSGSIPPTLFYPFKNLSLALFSFTASFNGLNGSLPGYLFPQALLTTGGSFALDLANNGLSGDISPYLFGNLTSFGAFIVHLQSNSFTSLPTHLFASAWSGTGDFTLQLANNALQGTISPVLFIGNLQQNITIPNLTFDVTNNQLSGSIPENLFYGPTPITADRRSDEETETEMSTKRQAAGVPISAINVSGKMELQLSRNGFQGTLGSKLFTTYQPATTTTFTLVLGMNSLSGTLPEGLFAPVLDLNAASRVTITLNGNQLSGSLPSTCWSLASAQLTYGTNAFSGTIPATWGQCQFYSLNIGINSGLHGSIPAGIFNSTTLRSFYASYTGLEGTMSPVQSTLTDLDLSFTSMNFCDNSSSSYLSNYTGYCSLKGTSACYCQSDYQKCDTTCAATPVTIIPWPSSVPLAPPAVPSCPERTRPSTDFVCTGGIWVAGSTNSSTTLTIPTGAGTVLVTGNFTSTTVVFQGLGSSINITGGASNLTLVTIELSPAQAGNLGGNRVLQILISTNGSGPGSIDLNSVAVNSKVTSGCKKVKAQKVILDDGKTLGAYLSLDNSGCKTWWIITVSVIAGLVFLAVIALILLGVFYKPFRQKIRPYSNARRRRAATTAPS